jgi:hypothetical protein
VIPGGLHDGPNSFLSPLRLPVPPSRLSADKLKRLQD